MLALRVLLVSVKPSHTYIYVEARLFLMADRYKVKSSSIARKGSTSRLLLELKVKIGLNNRLLLETRLLSLIRRKC
jgi:hypothetical protein